MRDDKCLSSFEKTLKNLRNTRFKFFKVNFDDLMASCSLLYFKFFLKQMKLLILTIKWPPTHTYYCIFTQSFFFKKSINLTYSTTYIFFSYSLPAIYSYTQDDVTGWYYKKLFPYIASWVYGVALIAQTGSIYCTLGVTVERYIVVCFPLR